MQIEIAHFNVYTESLYEKRWVLFFGLPIFDTTKRRRVVSIWKKVGTFSRFALFWYHKSPFGGIYMRKGGYFFTFCPILIPLIAAKWYLFERKCKIVPTVLILRIEPHQILTAHNVVVEFWPRTTSSSNSDREQRHRQILKGKFTKIT